MQMTESEQLRKLWEIVEKQRYDIELLQQKVDELQKNAHSHYADPIVSSATYTVNSELPIR